MMLIVIILLFDDNDVFYNNFPIKLEYNHISNDEHFQLYNHLIHCVIDNNNT